MTVFFHQRGPRFDDSLVTGYAVLDDHMVDTLELAALWLDRAAAVAKLRATATAAMAAADEALAALDARITEAAHWIEARIAASTALPLGEIALRCGLSEVDVRILSLLVAVEVDATLLHRLGSPPPLGLDATALYCALGWPAPQPTWLRSSFGPDAPLLSTGLVRFDDVAAPVSSQPATVARPVVQRLTGIAVRDDVYDLVVSPAPDYAEHPQAGELAGAVRTSGVGIALWISGPGPRLELGAAIARADRRRAVVIDTVALARDLAARQRAAVVARLALEQRLDDLVAILRIEDGTELEAVRAARLACSQLPGPCVLISADEHATLATLAAGAQRYSLPRLDASQRHAEWLRQLGGLAGGVGDGALAQLAADFPLDAMDIEEIVRALTRGGGDVSIERLRATALARQRSRLGNLTQFVPHAFAWDDLVLPEHQLAVLLSSDQLADRPGNLAVRQNTELLPVIDQRLDLIKLLKIHA
jgi:hypothetical protein